MKIIKITIYCFLCIIILSNCKNNSQKKNNYVIVPEPNKTEINKPKEKVEEINKLKILYGEDKSYLKAFYELPHIKEFYEWQKMSYTPPEALSYPENISSLSYDELRLLRNEIFARNGYLFNDGFLRGYFNRFNWYMPIFDVDSFKVMLNQQERKLIDKILIEESKRKEEKTFIQYDLTLYNADLIVNTKQFDSISENIFEDFQKQNFSIINANRAMPFYVYDKNAYQYIPNYITTDLYLFILHKYFSRFLEKLDENYMYKQLNKILRSTSNKLDNINSPSIQATLDWSKMYNAIALYALGDSLVNAPTKYENIFIKEKDNIDNQNGIPIFIHNKFVDYGELKPRGHYTKSSNLKKYFKGFKWISLNGINLDSIEQLKGMILLAYVIKNEEKLYNQYKQYVSIVEKLAGQEDNLSLSDIINFISARNINEVLSEKSVSSIKKKLDELDKERIKKVFGESFFPDERKIKRVYFLSSTYSLSGEIFSKLVHIDWSNSLRPFPRGLDIPAVFENPTAEKIIIDEYKDNEKWPEYLPKLKKLQDQFRNFGDWNHNYGYKGMQTALSSFYEQENYPDFMKTDAYNRKELSTALASWTHIKHDLILYQEKPYAAECGQGGGPEPPQHFSFVEPNLEFWDTALELVDWLEKLSMKESTFDDELQRIKKLGENLRTIAYKEIEGQKITNEEYRQLHYIGGTIEYILLGLLETDHIPERERSMGLIADVYVYNRKNLNVAVGHADDIYVIVPFNDEYHIARGAVFSYYEFKGKIYNDEEWRAMIRRQELPERPEWIKTIINEEAPLKGQMQFRYPGHGSY